MAESIEKQIARQLERNLRRDLVKTQVTNNVGTELVEVIEQNFESEGRPPWKQWSPGYAKWRQRQPYPLKIGTLTGTLRDNTNYLTDNTGVSLVNLTPYAEAFAEIRPIYTFPLGTEIIIADAVARGLNSI